MTQKEAIKLLYNEPIKIAKLIGFDRLTNLHNEWIKLMLKSTDDKTLQAHRGSYKTTCVTIALSILLITQPHKRMLFIRKTDTDVKEVIRQVTKILKTDEFRYLTNIIWDRELTFDMLTQNEINTTLNANISGTNQLIAFGINGSITGKHYDYIFTDDIVNLEDRQSKAERDFTKLIYQEINSNIKNRDGRIFNTGTPWHKEDAFILMPKPLKYDCYQTNLIDNNKIKQIKSEMAPSLFAANYELRHIASEDIIFDDPQWASETESFRVEQGICHIDAGYQGEDYTAFTIIKKYNDKYYVFGKMWRKHVLECIDNIIDWRKHFNAGKIYNETNADKEFLNEILRQKGERTEAYFESENKYIKIVTHLKKIWKDVIFISETDKEYVQQICDYNEDAEHDDAPDSLASVIRAMDHGSAYSFD